MKKIGSIVFSNKLTLVALVAFAASMAYATFLENDFGTPVARQLVYEAWWFELLMAILCVNFVGNIFRYRLLRKEKLSLLVFHLAFIVILLGAFVTRYTGQEGLVRIREGSATDYILSEHRYLKAEVEREGQEWEVEQVLKLTRFDDPRNRYQVGNADGPLEIIIDDFVPDAVQGLTSGAPEDEVLEIISSQGSGRIDHFLSKGSSIFINGREITFNNPKFNAVNVQGVDGAYQVESPEALTYIIMASQQVGRLEANTMDTLHLRTLYQSDQVQFVIKAVHRGQKVAFQTTDDKEMAKDAADLLFITLKDDEQEKQMILASVDGVFSPPQISLVGDYKVNISYGPKRLPLPFEMHLVDFQLERYPGSTSPSSYASELIVNDGETSFPVRISMNNVLDYRGYRFFQASYDMDELGTVLSVNRDFWGTQITYLGYLLMGLGMVITLFGKNSRFQFVSRQLTKMKAAAVIILVPLAFQANASDRAEENSTPVLSIYIDPTHAKAFGKLMVQDMDGRIKPLNTLASEFLRKLTRKASFKLEGASSKWSSDQVFLSLHQSPTTWQNVPIIKVDQKKGGPILEELGFEERTLLSFQDLIDESGNYKLSLAVEAAQRKKPAERDELDNELIKVDERFNILFQALSGNYLKIFPEKNNPEHTWFNREFFQAGFSEEDSLFVKNILGYYYFQIEEARASGDWSSADDQLAYIQTFQRVMGSEVIPDQRRVNAELLYNELSVFNRLFPIYWLLGIGLLVLAITRVFSIGKIWKVSYQVLVGLMALAFLTQTLNMILRWYAGGYPPWSNGYEMIILVSWALFLFGFIFYRRSDFIMPVVGLFGGTLLFVSYLDWLNPEITNLVPVLKSYWLKIHVAIIVSSYAPLALSALLGFISLVFMSIRNEKFDTSIRELTYINELSMTIGLFMLAIGTFLGGVWANESWGRYWGWDPKETWALISIIVYAVVLHLRLIPSLKGPYTFNLASVIAFFSIIMTSFGVNYYLTGLHSYAAGDPLPIPTFVYWVVAIIFFVGMLAYFRGRKMSVITN